MLIERLERVALAGGSAWVLYLLISLSFVSIGIMVERWFFFRRRRDDVDGLSDNLVGHLRRGDRRAAEQMLERSPSIEALTMRPVLDWLEGGPEAVQEALDCEMGRRRRELERSMTFLGTLGNNAPFVGLLGTVLGVIQAFHQLGQGMDKQANANVMAGIAEALIATGVGLIVALPAVVAYNVFQKKANEIEANVAVMGKKLLAFLKARAKLAAELGALGESDPGPLGELVLGVSSSPGAHADAANADPAHAESSPLLASDLS